MGDGTDPRFRDHTERRLDTKSEPSRSSNLNENFQGNRRVFPNRGLMATSGAWPVLNTAGRSSTLPGVLTQGVQDLLHVPENSISYAQLESPPVNTPAPRQTSCILVCALGLEKSPTWSQTHGPSSRHPAARGQ